jgi:hypothetical protein
MKKSQSIGREITELQRRREQLASEATEARERLTEARRGLVSGTMDAGQVTAAQSTYTALSEAVLDVDGRLQGLRADLARALEVEGAEINAQRVEGLREEMRGLQADFDRHREETSAALLRAAEREVALSDRFSAAARELHQREGGQFRVGGFKEQPVRFGAEIAACVRSLFTARERERRKAKAA